MDPNQEGYETSESIRQISCNCPVVWHREIPDDRRIEQEALSDTRQLTRPK